MRYSLMPHLYTRDTQFKSDKLAHQASLVYWFLEALPTLCVMSSHIFRLARTSILNSFLLARLASEHPPLFLETAGLGSKQRRALVRGMRDSLANLKGKSGGKRHHGDSGDITAGISGRADRGSPVCCRDRAMSFAHPASGKFFQVQVQEKGQKRV